jgi:hypothetical protein
VAAAGTRALTSRRFAVAVTVALLAQAAVFTLMLLDSGQLPALFGPVDRPIQLWLAPPVPRFDARDGRVRPAERRVDVGGRSRRLPAPCFLEPPRGSLDKDVDVRPIGQARDPADATGAPAHPWPNHNILTRGRRPAAEPY